MVDGDIFLDHRVAMPAVVGSIRSGGQQMLGLIAAAIFALAFVLDLINEMIGDITTTTLRLAGLACLALYLSGVGPRSRI
jgi:hypothetical protein